MHEPNRAPPLAGFRCASATTLQVGDPWFLRLGLLARTEVFPMQETSKRYLHQETAQCRRVVVVLQFPLGQQLQVCFQVIVRSVRR